MQSEGPYTIDTKGEIWWILFDGEKVQTAPKDLVCNSALICSLLNTSYAEGRKSERERNSRSVVALCGVNPGEMRPCIEKVDKKFWCPVCLCADSIRGGQDGQ